MSDGNERDPREHEPGSWQVEPGEQPLAHGHGESSAAGPYAAGEGYGAGEERPQAASGQAPWAPQERGGYTGSPGSAEYFAPVRPPGETGPSGYLGAARMPDSPVPSPPPEGPETGPQDRFLPPLPGDAASRASGTPPSPHTASPGQGQPGGSVSQGGRGHPTGPVPVFHEPIHAGQGLPGAPNGPERPVGRGNYGGYGGYEDYGGQGWPPPGIQGAPARQRQGPRGVTMVIVAVLIALVAGSAGSFLTTRLTGPPGAEQGNDRDYNLGTAPRGSKNRPPGSVAGVSRQVLPSVVSLRVTGTAAHGSGSGFIIKGGYIVTNNHVVAPAAHGGRIKVRFHNEKVAPATIVGRDPDSDIAVIKPQGVSDMQPARLGNSNSVVVGDPVLAVGSPLGLAGTVTYGIVSALHRPVTAGGGGSTTSYFNAIQTDAAVNPGSSGGPLVDLQGRVIGVNSAIASVDKGNRGQSGSIGLGFAIPVNRASRVAEQLIRTGEAHHAVIGVRLDLTYRGDGAQIRGSQARGKPAIAPEGPAEKAGLRPGDVIVEFDGKPVSSAKELIVAIRRHSPGDTVRLAYRRDGEKRTISVTLGKSGS